MVLNGYAKRTSKTTASNPGVLGLLRNYFDGSVAKDLDGKPFTIIGFGNGYNRPNGNRSAFADLTDDVVFANTYHQEAAIRLTTADGLPGAETHGGTDVFIGAQGNGAETFQGFMDNTKVFYPRPQSLRPLIRRRSAVALSAALCRAGALSSAPSRHNRSAPNQAPGSTE